MADGGELDDLPLAGKEQFECATKTVRRGLSSLGGARGQLSAEGCNQSARQVKMKSKPRLPLNGFHEMAKLLVDAPSKGKDRAVMVQVWREVKETHTGFVFSLGRSLL
jgi:hypothetical protein